MGNKNKTRNVPYLNPGGRGGKGCSSGGDLVHDDGT
jgi:hypothetical protein